MFLYFQQFEVVKYIGKEHYCPLSLLRVYGMTEVEEYEDNHEFENENDDAAETAKKSDEQDKSGYFESAKQAVVGLVNNVAETFSGSKRDNNGTSRHGGDIVTLVNPDHMFDIDDANFITTCIQRTLYSEYNTSLNPIFRFGLTYVLIKRMCPSLKMFRSSPWFRRTKKKHKSITPLPPPPLLIPTLNKIKPPSTKSLKEDSKTKPSDGTTTTALPTTTEDLTKKDTGHQETTTTATESSEKDTKQVQSESSHNKVEATVRDSPIHEVATTTKGSDTTCSKLKTPDIDITKLVPQPSFTESHAAASGNGVQATTALKAVDLKDEISVTSSSSPSSMSSNEKESSLVVVPLSSSVAMTTEESVDVLEFKTNSNKDTSSMVAEKVVEDESFISKHEKHQSSSDVKDVVLEKKIDVEKKIVIEEELKDSKVILSPSSSEKESTGEQIIIKKDDMKMKKDEHVIIEPSSSVETLSSTSTTNGFTVTKEAASISQDVTSETVQPNKAKQVQATVTTGLPASKESIIVKLNAKIKALQMNLTMSMMYLEEMSEK